MHEGRRRPPFALEGDAVRDARVTPLTLPAGGNTRASASTPLLFRPSRARGERPGQAHDLFIREAFEPEAPVVIVDGSARLLRGSAKDMSPVSAL